jgi:hypothetical protein
MYVLIGVVGRFDFESTFCINRVALLAGHLKIHSNIFQSQNTK